MTMHQLATKKLSVDASFPGGNVLVEEIDGNKIFLHQDHRDSVNDRYWNFRVRGAAGRELTVHLTQGDVFTALGPAVTLDRGLSYSWLGPECVGDSTFRFQVPKECDEVRLSIGIPYVEEDLQRFLRPYQGSNALAIRSLCETPYRRKAELIRLGRLSSSARHRILIVCRHHACEAVAGYVLEGVMQAVLADDESGAWLRNNVEMVVVPFVDKDGVEEGHQGKSRAPHDPNRDYAGESIYPVVAAIRQWVPQWSEGSLRLGLDLHCPYLRGELDEKIFFVEPSDPERLRELDSFSAALENSIRGPLPYLAGNNLKRGVGWNTTAYFRSTITGTLDRSYLGFASWLSGIQGVRLAASLEFPYALASSVQVNAETARLFGVDLANAIRIYLAEDR